MEKNSHQTLWLLLETLWLVFFQKKLYQSLEETSQIIEINNIKLFGYVQKLFALFFFNFLTREYKPNHGEKLTSNSLDISTHGNSLVSFFQKKLQLFSCSYLLQFTNIIHTHTSHICKASQIFFHAAIDPDKYSAENQSLAITLM